MQQRGNSFRVQHYLGYKEGKRIYQYHKVSNVEVNGSKSMEVKETDNSIFNENKSWGWELNPYRAALQATA